MESFALLPKKHHAVYLVLVAALCAFHRYMKPKKGGGATPRESQTNAARETVKGVCVAVLVGCHVLYGSAVYAGYTPNPIFPLLTSMRNHVLQLSDYFRNTASMDDHIEKLHQTVEMRKQIEQCQGNATCFDMLRDAFRPIIVEWNAMARVYLANASGNVARKGFAGLVDFFDAFLAFNTTEEHGDDTGMMQQIMLNIVLNSVSEATKNELPEHLRSITADELAKLASGLKENAAKRIMAEKNLRDLLNEQEFLAYLIGTNEDINSWRNQLQMWGMSRSEALIVVGSLGPMVQGLLAFTRAIVKHAVDLMYAPEIVVGDGKRPVRGSLKPTGMTVFGVVSRLLFSGEGSIYIFHLVKVWVMAYMFRFFLPGGFFACYVDVMIVSYKEARQTGGFNYKVLLFLRALAKAPSIVVKTLILAFAVGNTIGLVASLSLQIAGDVWDFVAPVWWPFLLPHELDKLTRAFSRHLLSNWRSLLGSLIVAAACMAVHAVTRHFELRYKGYPVAIKDVLEGIILEETLDGLYTKEQLDTAKRTRRNRKLGNVLFYLFGALSWLQPFIGVIVKESAPMFGAEWILGLPQIGHLDMTDGGINYLWSLLDLATLPLEYFRLQ